MKKPWFRAACLLLALACLVARAEVARCEEDTKQVKKDIERTIERVCRRFRPNTEVRRLECRAVVVMSYGWDNPKRLQEALTLLNQAHAMAPFDRGILCNIATCYIRMRNYEVALRYLDQVLLFKPSFVGVRFFKCLLEERLGYPAEKCKACYRRVAQYYEYRLQTSGLDYVFVELMLGGPNAERVKKNFLAGLKPDANESNPWIEMLRNFNREKYLHVMLR